MSLSSELVSQFVKATKDDTKKKSETTVYGTTVEYNGATYVQLDGSELLTPVTTTTDIAAGERVTVMIKNHTATVTGNVSSPSAKSSDVQEMGKQISEFQVIVADRVTTEQLNAEQARIDKLVAENVTITEKLTAYEADIDEIVAKNVKIEETLTAADANIKSLQTEKLDAELAKVTYAEIKDLEAVDAKVYNLDATYGDFVELTASRFDSIEANILDLDTGKLSAIEAEIKYANIDFTNIGEAAIEHFYATSGLIEDVVVDNGTITGHLVGVTIKGDLIEGGTVVADKLVIKGEDGLYYKINTDGVTTESEQTEYNSISGSVITAKSITATKISVSDLVAFDATIGGFNITEKSLYSGVKASIDNTTSGVYLDSEGQVTFGDSSNYIKYYKDPETGAYKLDISAQSIILSASNTTVEDAIADVENTADGAKEDAAGAQNTANNAIDRTAAAETAIQVLVDSIATLVTDGTGASVMTQTADGGWTFSIGEIADAISKNANQVNDLSADMDSTKNAVDSLQQAVLDLGVLANYIKITLDGDQPCIELGETDSDFKVRITNTEIQFEDGTIIPTRITRKMMIIEKAMVREEFRFGDEEEAGIDGVWIWKRRSNGNLGLIWKDVN